MQFGAVHGIFPSDSESDKGERGLGGENEKAGDIDACDVLECAEKVKG